MCIYNRETSYPLDQWNVKSIDYTHILSISCSDDDIAEKSWTFIDGLWWTGPGVDVKAAFGHDDIANMLPPVALFCSSEFEFFLSL